MARRSTSRSINDPGDTLVVGVIRGAHGVRGELRVAPDTDNPGRFLVGRRLIVEGLGERQILAVRGTAADLILRLEGIPDRDSAQALSGRELRVAAVEVRREAAGYLWADLVGMRVEDESGRTLGTLAEVLRPGGAADVFLVRDERGRELLLPVVDSVIREVDVAARRMVVRPQEEA